MVYTYTEILFGYKKEWSSDACYNMDELWKHYAKWNKPATRGHMFYDSTYMGYFQYINL